MKGKKIRIAAHRGARSIAPENTLSAARIAYETGADLWETDISITRDGQLILFHDETLLRCTDAASQFPSRTSYRVGDFTLEEILSLDAGSYFIATDPFSQIIKGRIDKKTLSSFKKERVPTLEQGLLFTKNKNWRVNLELKNYSVETGDTRIPQLTLQMIYHTRIPLHRVIISSFHLDWLKWFMKKEPDLEIQALVEKNKDNPPVFTDSLFSTYNLNADLIDENLIRHLKSSGKKINLFTVNDKEELSRFERLGIDGIFTDFPQWFAKKKS